MADYKVVDAEQLEADLTSVADALRAQSGKTEALAFPEGYVNTAAQLGAGSFEAGKQAEYDAFWDDYQKNGARADYRYAFSGAGWTEKNLRPKYDIVPSGNASYMFMNSQISGDLTHLLNGVKLDLSNATDCTSMFNSATKITKIGELNTNGSVRDIFAYCTSLETVEKLRFTGVISASSFAACRALKNIILDGTISVTGGDLHWSTLLSKDSITSVVNALSAATTGLTVTLSRTAVDNAFTAEEWETLADTKPNWTISLM